MALRSNRVMGQSCSEGGWLADVGPLEGQEGHWWGGRLGLLVQAHSDVWHKADSWTAGESKTMQSGWDRHGSSFMSSHDRRKTCPIPNQLRPYGKIPQRKTHLSSLASRQKTFDELVAC
jgi:hypothetical protein